MVCTLGRCCSWLLLIYLCLVLTQVEGASRRTSKQCRGRKQTCFENENPCNIYKCKKKKWKGIPCNPGTKCQKTTSTHAVCTIANSGPCLGTRTTRDPLNTATTTTTTPFTGTTQTTTRPPPREGEYVVMCYYSTWGRSRVEPGKYELSDLNASMCTHILYAFGTMTMQGEVQHGHWDDANFLPQLTGLKQTRPNLKILLSLGGASAGWPTFLAVTLNHLAAFVNNVITYLRANNLDGVDIDWEYPFNMKASFTKLLKALRQGFDAEALAPGQDRLELSAALSAGQGTIDFSYDIPAISKYLDKMIIMTYDLKIAAEGKAAHHSGLWTAYSGAKGDDATRNQNWVMNYYKNKGAPANKLVMGIPTYGRTFLLANKNQNTPGSKSIGAMSGGSITQEWSYLSYTEICLLGKEPGWTRVYDPVAQVPYYYNQKNWISYEDAQSVVEKVEYIRDKQLCGAAVWQLADDDFNNVCGDGAYPIMNNVAQLLP